MTHGVNINYGSYPLNLSQAAEEQLEGWVEGSAQAGRDGDDAPGAGEEDLGASEVSVSESSFGLFAAGLGMTEDPGGSDASSLSYQGGAAGPSPAADREALAGLPAVPDMRGEFGSFHDLREYQAAQRWDTAPPPAAGSAAATVSAWGRALG